MAKRIETHGVLRSGFLVSVAVIGAKWSDADIAALRNLAASLAGAFRFWEIVVVISTAETAPPETQRELASIRNIRVLRVGDVDNFYRMRLAAAWEAIGDVVVLTSADELGLFDLTRLADLVYASNQVVVMTRSAGSASFALFFRLLERMTDYRIEPRDTLTAGFPRSWLGTALARPDAELRLRFELRSGSSHFRREIVPDNRLIPRRLNALGRRFRLLVDLMASAAPKVLYGVSALSFCVTILAGLYGIYAILIWLLRDDVAPGWLTTSMLQVVIAGFLGIAFSATTIGIVKLFDRIEGVLHYTIVDELNNVDFFSEIKDLNVEVERRDHLFGEG